MKKSNDSNKKTSQTESKKYLYSSPYRSVIKVLNAIKDYILTINNNKSNNALEELNWVINIISNNLLYYYQKTSFFKRNIDVINGSHRIGDFSNDVDKYNKEYEDLYKKYLQINIRNEEYSNSLGFIEKNISFINDSKNTYNNNVFDNEKSLKSLKIKKNNHQRNANLNLLSHLSLNFLNDNTYKLFSENSSHSNINCTDFNSLANTKNINIVLPDNKSKLKELSINSHRSLQKNSNNNKNTLFNNYKILSKSNSKLKKKFNKILEKSIKKERENTKSYGDNLNSINSNRNQQFDKMISLPIIQFNFNGGLNIDKYKINIFNKKFNLNRKIEKYEAKKNSKTIANESELNKINNKIIQELNSIKNIDKNNIFDFQNFNIFILKDKLGLENIMPFLGKEIIKKAEIIHLLDELKLDKFLMALSRTYQNKKALYHTSLHGTDVCYSTLLILTFLKNDENKIENISELDKVSLIIAALGHDVGHPGLTNQFLINSRDELSTIYNDRSVLENFHCAKTFQLLGNNELNIFSNFSNEDFLSLRKKIIGEILSTDMSFHLNIINEYREYKKSRDEKLGQNQLNFITHIADLFHNYRKFDISIRWIELLSNEFWNQGDKEKELGLPVSFMCDRNNIDVPASQIAFLTNFSLPILQELIEVNEKFIILKNNSINNLAKWEKYKKEKRKRGWSTEKK